MRGLLDNPLWITNSFRNGFNIVDRSGLERDCLRKQEDTCGFHLKMTISMIYRGQLSIFSNLKLF